jgi:sugar (pentulose or hexulose) kinase
MASSILLGIDLGTTVLKICAFDARTGDVLAQGSRRLEVRTFPDGGREQDTESIDRAFRGIVRALRKQVGSDWRSVCGIGLAAQGGSSIVADRATGRALTPMVLWNDGRAHTCAGKIARRTSTAYWQKYTLRDFPPHGLARLLRLKETHPELLRRDAIHIGAGEYLFFAMTGVWRQDAGNAIQIGSYNAVSKRLDRTMLGLVGVPLSFVAPLRPGHETAPLSTAGARLLGVPEGIPVAGPYIDQEAGYLSAVGVSKRPLQCSLGTAWVGNFAVSNDATGGSSHQLVLSDPVQDGRLVVLPLLAGNTSWDWGLRTFLNTDHKKALSSVERVFTEALLPSDGLVAVPYVTQRNPLDPGSDGGGMFFGSSVQTSREDMLRALAAGMAFELARVFEGIRQSGTVDSIVLGGGASRGAHFRTLIAALFAPMPVRCQLDEDLAAARGAAYALSRKVARAKTQRVARPPKAALREIHRHYDRYVRAVALVEGAVSNATAIV